jgi:hypothetical protein
MNHKNSRFLGMGVGVGALMLTWRVLVIGPFALATQAPPLPKPADSEACTINQQTGQCKSSPVSQNIPADDKAPEPAASEARPADEPGGKKVKRRKKSRPLPTTSNATPASVNETKP